MAVYNKSVLTVKGNELLARAIAGEQIEFTRLETGSGIYDGTENLPSMDRLKNKQQEFYFLRYEKASEDSVLLVAMVSNEGLAMGYRMTEIGIYGKLKNSGEEILCSVAIAITDEADFIPPFNGLAPTRILLHYHMTISPDAEPCISVADDMIMKEISAESNRAYAAEMLIKRQLDKMNADLNPVAFSGSYEDLAGIPTKLSEFENDHNFVGSESPEFTGVPTAPTAPTNTNNEQIATTAFVKGVVAMLVNGASEDLDTLKEIEEALKSNRAFMDALNAAIGNKVDKVSGKGLSANDYTTLEKNKLSDIAAGAEVNVQADWSVTDPTSDAFIKNKPDSLPASDVSEWAKADKKPSYSKSEVGLGNVPNVSTNNQTPTFEQAEERENIKSGEKLSISLGKMMKWFADFSATAFDGLATKWRTARNINGMSVDGSANRANYGTCTTAAATVAKVVACTGYALVTGAEIAVKFTVTNTAANPTLNVNGTGAKPIYYRGAAITAGYLAANRTYAFRYNGTQYELVGDIDTNATYNNMSGATANANGKAGLVPAPGAGKQNAYLRGDGTWVTPTNNLLATEPGTPLDAVQGKNLKADVDAVNNKLDEFKIFTSLSSIGIDADSLNYDAIYSKMGIGNILMCYVPNNSSSFIPASASVDYVLTVKCTGLTNSSRRLTFEAVLMGGASDTIYRARYSSAAGTKWSGWKQMQVIN